jgi:3,4-dihydroxy 2-butanone 4-phosphate synthase/GTP cyclohydrolase II
MTAAARARLAAGGVIVLASDDLDAPCALVAAGDRMTTEAANLMATHGHSLLSVCVPASRYERLGLPPSDPDRGAARPFAAPQSIEAAAGVTTGISAADRAATIRAAAAPDAGAGSVHRPGHVLIAPVLDHGVLGARRLREAAADLARLAGATPVAAMCPVLDRGGVPLSSARAAAAAASLCCPWIAVGDVLAERLRNDLTLVRVDEETLATPQGRFRAIAYADSWRGADAVALAGLARRSPAAEVTCWRDCARGGVGCDCGIRLAMLLASAAQTGGAVARLGRRAGSPLSPCHVRPADVAEQAYVERLGELIAADLDIRVQPSPERAAGGVRP